MAKNTKSQNNAAAKAKKQKVILGLLGVALLGLAVIQGPKLMKQIRPSAAVATPAAPAAEISPAPSTGSAVVVRTTSESGPKAVLAGVTINGGVAPAPAEGQLHSFSLFALKDPFLPQASDEVPVAASTPAPAPAPAPSTPEGGTGSGSPGSGATAAAPPSNVTITMNGRAYPVAVKGSFPKADPLFTLISVKPKVAKIGVAGGSFEDGKTIALRMGKQTVLVNDATGARYSLKLVYTGTEPEKTESFTQAAK